MNWKKIFSLILVLAIVILAPITKTFAETNDDKDKKPDEIIDHEDTPNEDTEKQTKNENIPDPPRDESLIGDEEDVKEIEIETPSSVTGEKMEGTGTVVDFSTTGARAFYTIVDNDNNTFYLMIDMDKADNNVYFLSDVNQEQLGSESASSSKSDNKNIINDQENNETEKEDEETQQAVATEKKDDKKDESSNLMFTLIVVLVGVVGAFGYYFLVVKKKNAKNASDDPYDEDDEMLEIYEDEDMYADNEDVEENKQPDESDHT